MTAILDGLTAGQLNSFRLATSSLALGVLGALLLRLAG